MILWQTEGSAPQDGEDRWTLAQVDQAGLLAQGHISGAMTPMFNSPADRAGTTPAAASTRRRRRCSFPSIATP